MRARKLAYEAKSSYRSAGRVYPVAEIRSKLAAGIRPRLHACVLGAPSWMAPAGGFFATAAMAWAALFLSTFPSTGEA